MRSMLLMFLCLLPFAACGGDSHESLSREAVTLMSDVVTTLEGVSDKASAEAAKPKIESLKTKAKALKKRMDALGKPSPEAEAALEKKYEPEMKPLVQRFMAVMMKFSGDEELQKTLGEAMQGFDFGK